MTETALAEVVNVLGIPGDGGRRTSTPMGFISMIEEGLPVTSLDRVSHAVAPADAAFKHRIVARATLARRRRDRGHRLSAEESGRLARLARIWAASKDVWKTEDDARAFLFRHHPLLESRLPIDVVIGSDVGARMVEEILGRLKYGSAA